MLYVIFAFNSIGHSERSLLAINVGFSFLLLAMVFNVVYQNRVVNALEAFIYLNMIILSAIFLAHFHNPALVYTLIGVIFAITIAVVLYHFYLLYITKSALGKKLKAKLVKLARRLKIIGKDDVDDVDEDDEPLLDVTEIATPNVVTCTVVGPVSNNNA